MTELYWEDGQRHVRGKCTEEIHDKYHGLGKYTYPNGDVYEGYWVNNKRHGQGKCTYSSGEVYKGQWVNDKRHGQGTITIEGNSRECTWKDDYPQSWSEECPMDVTLL